ncbi:MAG: twin-arginine translocase TatA/TatE family subunit [Actinomycetota bacterium]|nr:twin-arginine translocase TatA/TatE family subunit [Actinomycetota bacterium]MDD5666946.1 twin-arginine translocase TatA/TatE family subunit [Actinomycetota bacterium]
MLALFQSFGPTELLIILGIALVIFGPTQLPKLGRSIGKAIRELRASSSEVTKAVQEGLEGKDEEEKASKKKASKKKAEEEEIEEEEEEE